MTKPIDNLLAKADSILLGEGDILEDWRDALQIYESAAAMESGKAHYRLGFMFNSSEYGKVNLEKALFHYKQAVRLGFIPAAAEMAIIYAKDKDKANCIKMWQFYFGNIDQSLEEKDSIFGDTLDRVISHFMDAYNLSFSIIICDTVMQYYDEALQAISEYAKNRIGLRGSEINLRYERKLGNLKKSDFAKWETELEELHRIGAYYDGLVNSVLNQIRTSGSKQSMTSWKKSF